MSLTVTNLSKRYDDNWVLRDVNFEATSGEIFGIFGASGAGKSTLIRLISGDESCTSGTIHHNSTDVSELSCENRDFHFPKLTNESFWKALFQTDKKSQLADGEGQAIALEDAMQRADNVLLLDDSFCYMDRLLRQENYGRLKRTAQKKNLIVIVATNDFSEVLLLCDRAGVLDNGEIKQTGTPREIYETPNSAAVARISGRNNLIEARRLTSEKSDLPEFQTVVGEHRLFAQKTENLPAGATNQVVTLAIRPEHISISFGASFPEDNLLRAVITDIKFNGATTIIRLDSGGLQLEALVLRLVGLNVGDECMVGLPPDRILILND
ncbi:MAG TPA: ABC transporter ATP-binding protein [Pyrinomonadaceae bacterium]|jgi:ABC-type Fe3+/spermidine/putrescine transport system ATPase subunit